MEISQAYFLNKITNVLGLSVKQCEVLYNDGYYSIYTIIHWKYDKIREWFTTKYNFTTTRGGASYGDLKIKCLQALAWWANDLILRVKQMVLSEFEANIM